MNEQQKVNEVIQRVNELTELAVSSPDGLHEVAAILGQPINIYQSECGVMQGIAELVVPTNYEWKIMATTSGCRLVIKGIR